MMKLIKYLLPITIILLCAVGALYCLVASANGQNLSPRENPLLNYILCIFSVLGSWLASHYYAIYSTRTTATEKIDTIAQQSAEKIMNQSAQLWEVEQYLENSVEAAEDETAIQTANNTLRNRVLASAQMLRLLRSSNSTFTSDWAGVTSSEVRAKMENQVKQQRELFKIYSEFNADSRLPEGEQSNDSRGQKTPETLQRIEKAAKDLPAAALPTSPANYAKAVTITQFPMPSSKTEAQGYAILHVVRPVDNVTGRIKLLPEFLEAPDVSVGLKKTPPGVDLGKFTARAGTATIRGFNVHLTENEAGLVPVGDYNISYEARPKA